ncbi:helix-turn-helix domain-containing protein [Nocardioides sp. Kera G14]|uniref:helix-turn-helix domain-containing protein n=1 Tax=Nocardioides sp. Kera G14 TaxID=2884264 RepID=UPI001D0FF5D7|nr:helix-turn-helix domain-containing protein [Nocardioides sp. Kera G14]UDY22934.1 helix-turn-helix domain-containing protein [Nocardioides sp. Kera G14]
MLMREGKAVATYVVEVKRALASSSLQRAMNQLLDLQRRQSPSRPSPRPMLIARYVSSQQQRRLRERGITYADATGNLYLTSEDPLILVSDRGATADPWRGPGRPTTSLKGLPAAKLVRALADFTPPYSVAELAELAGASLGAAYRLVDYLADEGLLARTERGPITEVDWAELLRRWSQEARYLDTSMTRGFLEPRGLDSLVEKLGNRGPTRYAVSGSLATRPYAPYAEARLALIYTEDPVTLASELGLRPVETGANILLATPRSPVVFERTSTWRGVDIVAPSQAAADLLGSPGRNPAEGDYLLDWMKENEDVWRRQPDR